MSVDLILELGWKSLVLGAIALGILALAGRRSAAEKSLAADAALLTLLALPLAMLVVPAIEFSPPAELGAAIGSIAPSGGNFAALPADGGAAIGDGAVFPWGKALLALYLVPALLLLGGLGLSLVNLRNIYRRARVVEDPRWLTALAAAQNRVGVKHGTALLISEEIHSPISWGFVRPVIMIDPGAGAATDQAEAIIAHELAHVQRLDWLKLVAGRAVTAIFWFNPLVWALARHGHQLREEAADDAVLRARVARAEYASLLVTSVRHASTGHLLATNGVAPSASSIALRVNHVLDESRPRRPAKLQWTGASLLLAVSANAALAAAEPVLDGGFRTDPAAGERAAAQLAALPSPQARTLARAIGQRDWPARRVAGRTTYGDRRLLAPLLLALRDDDAAVRRIALWGLSEMRPAPQSAAPAVEPLLDDASPEVRAEAARLIGEFRSIDGSPPLGRLLLGDPSADVRLASAHALGDIQDPRSRRSLEAAIGDPDPEVRAKARWALRQIAEAEYLLNR